MFSGLLHVVDNTKYEAFVSQYKSKCSSTAIGVYRVKCKERSKVYIGEIGEHKNNCKHYITGKSAIADHRATQKHAIDIDSACDIYPENNSVKRKLAEALYITSEQVFETNSPSTSLFMF